MGLSLGWIACSLAACGSAAFSGATRDADKSAAAAFADCNNQLAAGRLKSYREAVDCARPRVIAAYREAAYPYMDLINFDLEERDIGALRIDTGSADAAAVARDIAVLEERLKAERDRRIAARNGFGGAAPPVTVQQLLAGLNTLQEHLPQAKSCFSLGTETRCN